MKKRAAKKKPVSMHPMQASLAQAADEADAAGDPKGAAWLRNFAENGEFYSSDELAADMAKHGLECFGPGDWRLASD